MSSKVPVASFLVSAACWAVCPAGQAADSVAVLLPVRSAHSQSSGNARRFLRFRKIPTGGTVCIHTVQNLSGRTLDMRDVDDELAAQISQTGYRAGKQGTVETCDATVYTEIVRVEGYKRINAEVEFRVLLADEQVPRLCTRAQGRVRPLASFINSLVPIQKNSAITQREAIVAAFTDQALKIEAAQAGGMELYPGVEQH